MVITLDRGSQAPTSGTPVGRGQAKATARAVRGGHRRSGALLRGVVLAGVLVASLVPIVYLLALSFTPQSEVLAGNVIPRELTLANWPAMYERLTIEIFMLNSIVAAVVGTLVSLVIAALVAYAIVRFRTGGEVLPTFVLSSFVAPPVVAIIPLFFLLRWTGLLNQPLGLALVYGLVNVSVATWLLQSFVERIPVELEEAASIDGAGPVRTLVRVVLPLMAPGLVATGVVILILNFNELIFALTVVQRAEGQTLPVAISLFQGDRGVQFGQMAAASLTAMLPVYIAAVFLQKWLVAGLTSGAVK